ncbi:uncharacterized protein LOC141619428 isoform X1 [Silene latifolia]|uniref:uncharacterized protein LOC141619428 isoform X1 n=1 Tax=Silene latifolia TaxID=37657 RepID=UPI003D76CF47
MPKAVVVEDFPSCFGKKLSLGKASCLRRKTKGMKRMDDSPFSASRFAGKDSSSGEKPNTTKPKGNAEAFHFRPVEKSLPKAKKRNRFEEEEPLCYEVTGTVDLSAVTEAMNRKVDMDEIFFGGSEGLKRKSNEFATAALSYLQEEGHKLELVKAGSYEGKVAGYGMIFHHNFKAKRADDPYAPVEMYFAQLNDGARLVVDCCVSLGEADSLPYQRDNQGCNYCTQFVHHPHGGCEGMIWGRLVWGPGVNQYTVV